MSQGREAFSPDFRYEVVVRTLTQIANSELVTGALLPSWSKGFQDDVTENFHTLMRGIVAYSDPNTTAAQRDELEPQLFTSILYLKAVEFLTPTINKDAIITSIARLDQRFDALTILMRDILSVLTHLTKKVEAMEKQ